MKRRAVKTGESISNSSFKTEVIQMPSNDDVSTAEVDIFFDVLTQRTSDVGAFKKNCCEN